MDKGIIVYDESLLLRSREGILRERYGELLTLAELANLFRYPSSQALLKARARGQLAVPLIKFPNRRGWFATARAVADYLDRIDTVANGSDPLHRPT